MVWDLDHHLHIILLQFFHKSKTQPPCICSKLYNRVLTIIYTLLHFTLFCRNELGLSMSAHKSGTLTTTCTTNPAYEMTKHGGGGGGGGGEEGEREEEEEEGGRGGREGDRGTMSMSWWVCLQGLALSLLR